VFSTSPGVPRLADSYTPMELCTTAPLGTWLSSQSVRRRLPAPAGGRADRSIGPLVGKRWFRVLSSCRRPSSGPLWFFGPPAASPSRAFPDPPPPKTTHGVERQELTGQLSNDGDTQSRSIASCCLPFSSWFPMRVWRWLCLGPPQCRAARLSTSGSSLTFSAVWALWSPRLLSQLRNCLGWLARTCCSPANPCKVACGSLR
jgi:hypothetical protein